MIWENDTRKKLKVAIFGLAHPHAAMLTKTFKALPDEVEILGYAEVGPYDDQTFEERYRNIGKSADDLKKYDDWHELLALAPDVAVVATENSVCADVSCEILSKGISSLKSSSRKLKALASAILIVSISKVPSSVVILTFVPMIAFKRK